MQKCTFIIAVASLLTSPFNAAALHHLAVLMPENEKFMTVLEEMRKQAGNDYRFHVIDMKKSANPEDIAAQCKSNDIQALVLMDTKAIKAALKLENFDSVFKALPKFVFMTLMVESMTQGLSNVAGIKFEIPFYTIVTKFRIISKNEIKKVGIFYRKPFTSIIEESKKLLKKEDIAILPVCVDCDGKQRTDTESVLKIMNNSLENMVKIEKIDVFLAPADYFIVNSMNLGRFWIDKVKKMKVPVIAPLDILASEKIGVAVFAVDPDLVQLGVQAAGQIVDYFENNTSMKSIGFEPPISIKSTLNLRVSHEIGWKLKNDKLRRITNIIN